MTSKCSRPVGRRAARVLASCSTEDAAMFVSQVGLVSHAKYACYSQSVHINLKSTNLNSKKLLNIHAVGIKSLRLKLQPLN